MDSARNGQAYVGVGATVGGGAFVGGGGGAAGMLVTSATVQTGPWTETIESAIQASLPFTQQTFHHVPARFRPTTVISVPEGS